jgi:hypothetical protein
MGKDDQVGQGEASDVSAARNDLERLRAQDVGNEKRIVRSELGVGAPMAFLLFIYLVVS